MDGRCELEAVWVSRNSKTLRLRDLEGLVVTRYEHLAPCEYIEVIRPAHPVPDAMGF
ncbi:glycerate-2-kinase family protein [Vibrio chagasii]|nr:glycerate-2-kinase family protein [Vibrio chagasii]